MMFGSTEAKLWSAAALLFLVAVGTASWAFLRLSRENAELRKELDDLKARYNAALEDQETNEPRASAPDGEAWSETTSVSVEPPPPESPRQAVWSLVASSADWLPRHGHASVVHENKIWILGGDAGSGDFHSPNRYHPMNDVWASTDGSTWREITGSASWEPRRDHSSVVFKGKIWVLGGEDPESRRHFRDVWYSEDGESWTQATTAAPWEPRRGHATVVHDGKMWVIGGATSTQYLDDVWYSANGTDWARIESSSPVGEENSEEKSTDFAPWSGRYLHEALAFKDKIWLLGGGFKNDVWQSRDGKNWTEVAAAANWKERQYHSAVVAVGQMCILGGNDGPRKKSDMWCSTDGGDWNQVTDSAPWGERTGHSSVFFDHKVWVMGGRMDDPDLTSDVWSFPLDKP